MFNSIFFSFFFSPHFGTSKWWLTSTWNFYVFHRCCHKNWHHSSSAPQDSIFLLFASFIRMRSFVFYQTKRLSLPNNHQQIWYWQSQLIDMLYFCSSLSLRWTNKDDETRLVFCFNCCFFSMYNVTIHMNTCLFIINSGDQARCYWLSLALRLCQLTTNEWIEST